MSDWGRNLCDVPICVDGRMLGKGGTGVSTYARSLAMAVRRISSRPYRMVARNTDDDRLMKWADALRSAPRRLHQVNDAQGMLLEGRDIFRRAYVHFGIRRQLYPVHCDLEPGIMHWTYPVPMRMEGWINLYTVHDTIPLDRPDLTPINPSRYRAVLNAIVARGDKITTVSQSARAGIVATLGCDPTFVTDTGQPVDIGDGTSIGLQKNLVRHRYFVVVGSIEPRKNLTAVLDAFRKSGTGLSLVVAGPDGWCSGPILRDIASTPGAIHIPYVERATLLALIQNARALIFPSLAEGFGLPMAEAMALGTPVLTSDRGALAEIAGGAALTIDPTDIGAIRDALVRLASDDALTTVLTNAGTARVTAFSQDRFVSRLVQVYADALQTAAGTVNGRGLHE